MNEKKHLKPEELINIMTSSKLSKEESNLVCLKCGSSETIGKTNSRQTWRRCCSCGFEYGHSCPKSPFAAKPDTKSKKVIRDPRGVHTIGEFDE